MNELFHKYKDIILDHDIELWESEPTAYRIKARINFIDRSSLFIKDYLFPSGRKYTYHWQGADGELRVRWDNAPHWKDISTFPHHKHVRSAKNVEESTEVVLNDVLDTIRRQIKE